MEIGELIYHNAVSKGAQIVRFVDISCLPETMTRGYQRAVLVGKLLSCGYMKKLKTESITDYGEFSNKEHETDMIADEIAELINHEGYGAYSQSERNLLQHGDFEETSKRTPLPHKTIAVLSGLGWIGKDNLLVTNEYGSALCMCTILTNAPLNGTGPMIRNSRCKDSCRTCVTVCPSRCITGKQWSIQTDRDELVNVHTCGQCLKCMAYCPYTARYTRRISYRPLKTEESLLLIDFLYEAIYQPADGSLNQLTRNDILLDPKLFHYISEFGRINDHCFVASKEDQPVGAIWSRVFSKEDPGYGFVDEDTPELAMSVLPAYRNKGIGRTLLTHMLHLLYRLGYKQVSLSVQKDNFACRLYESFGFQAIHETESEYIMICRLSKEHIPVC